MRLLPEKSCELQICLNYLGSTGFRPVDQKLSFVTGDFWVAVFASADIDRRKMKKRGMVYWVDIMYIRSSHSRR